MTRAIRSGSVGERLPGDGSCRILRRLQVVGVRQRLRHATIRFLLVGQGSLDQPRMTPGMRLPQDNLPVFAPSSGFRLLAGDRVLDLTSSIAGPVRTMLLADLGVGRLCIARASDPPDVSVIATAAMPPSAIRGRYLRFAMYPPRSRRRGKAGRASRTAATKLTSKTRLISAISNSARGAREVYPATLTTTAKTSQEAANAFNANCDASPSVRPALSERLPGSAGL